MPTELSFAIWLFAGARAGNSLISIGLVPIERRYRVLPPQLVWFEERGFRGACLSARDFMCAGGSRTPVRGSVCGA